MYAMTINVQISPFF